jgi:hypothetical protein
VIALLRAALLPDDIVIGGGNAEKLDPLPEGCRLGDNANAFIGGFRLWAEAGRRQGRTQVRRRAKQRPREEAAE